MRSIWKWVAVAVVVTLLLGVGVAMKNAPDFIQKSIQEFVAKNCPNCELNIAAIDVSLFRPGHFTLRGIRFASGKEGLPELEGKIATLTIHLDLLPLLKREVRIGHIHIEKPDITYRDVDTPEEKEEKKARTARTHLPFEMRGARVVGGRFEYVRQTMGTQATLNIRDINAQVAPFGLENDVVEIEARGQIEKSGEVALNIRVPILSTPQRVALSAYITNQNLADVTPFFKENAGVELNGTMIEGRAKVSAEGDQLEAVVWAKYRDFELKLSEMHDRSPTAEFFMNLGTALVMNEKNTGKKSDDQQRGVKITREPKEPWVGFILRGIKEAALKVSIT